MHGPKSAAPAHESARLHVTGQAAYVDDLVELEGTLHAALGLSEHAHARIRAIDLDAVRRAPGVVRVVTAADIPGANNCGPILQDDPVLAETEVCYFGQPVFAVLAETRDQARHAARLARIDYAPLPAEFSPIEAAARGRQVVPPLHLVRGDAAQVLATAPRRLAGCFEVGGQEHFYLEGQVTYAVPREGEGLHIWCSTQHPSEMQSLVCGLLELRAHQVVVETRRMGGGFGGKESQSALFCCVAALGARLSGRPVKLRPDRDEDFLITGKRHAVSYRYEVGFEPGGRILALRLEMVLDAGYSADLSAPVATRAVCHVDNAYYLDAVDVRAVCARTHTQSNTAFRGFGGPQGALAVEYVIDDIARALDLDPLVVRRANFYAGEGRDTTPYGQKVEDNVIVELVDALVGDSDYPTRRQAIARFNADSTVLKKGLALTPVKFGISFNLVHFNQGGALVHVYTDGSVLINHGGTEMGQGLHTKVAQVVAEEFHSLFAVATLQGIKAQAIPGKLDEAMYHGSGGSALKSEIQRHAERGRRADLDSAQLFLARYQTRPDGAAVARMRVEASTQAADIADGVPSPANSPDAPLNPEVFIGGARFLKRRGDTLAALLAKAEPGQTRAILDQCVEAVEHLIDMFSTDDSACDVADAFIDDLYEASELMVLMQSEQGDAPAADAATLLLQLRREMEMKLAA